MKEITVEKIIQILNLNIKNITITREQVDEDLSDLGMDSISFIQTIVLLEEEFQCEIPDEKLIISEMNTVSKIIDVLKFAIAESTK